MKTPISQNQSPIILSTEEPEWLRADGVKSKFGIKSGTLYNLLADGLVVARHKRVRGTKKAMTLWNVQSIRDYILSPETDLPRPTKGRRAL